MHSPAAAGACYSSAPVASLPLIQIGPPRDRPFPDLGWAERLERLRALLRDLDRVVVAYSGGVDSSLVLRAACEVLGDRALGVIGRSDSYARRELELALAQAASFGAAIEIVSTGELSDPNFRSNPVDRCYHCKSELYRELAEVAMRFGARAVLDGTIVEDLGDWRPGRRAAEERAVQSPLADLGFTKADVRAAAAHYGLESRDKPASPCLASRIPYGTEITREALGQVEAAEELLRSLGFVELRVRHVGDMARIEVPLADLARLVEADVREPLVEGLKALGYSRVALDLEGFRSGSLNLGVAGVPKGRLGRFLK
ncbi:MAG TPA: ATP-dependent sacrificial sulfur transferase LarE [Candidatus Saccharimonadaceae bacterium]|nr:ATP-dependent sacrificial sulfur transferase LarE [Candidatus Saccharimonadaceae bacterium]